MSVSFMDPLNGYMNSLKYTNADGKTHATTIGKLKDIMAANKFFPKNDINVYDKISRYGYYPIYEIDQVCKEYLFFTKPDLNLFGDGSGLSLHNDCELNPSLSNYPFFTEANARTGDALRQLQYSVRDKFGQLNPFMYILSNTVTSKLDLPGISAESKESTANIMGTSIQYRGHSYKSDNGYDFTLSFNDTSALEVYTMVKAYDEYMRLLKIGEISPIEKYITSRIISEQFSIYKFLVGSDGETILFYSKLTGCYFTDVPRSDMDDPGSDGFKFSISFHAQFVEDSNPMILSEFNRISPGKSSKAYADVYNNEINAVDNTWVRWPKIIVVSDKQTERRGTEYDYKLKWIKG